MPNLVNLFFLVFAVFFPFYWYSQTSLSKFSAQLVALLTLVFIFHNWLASRRQKHDSLLIYQKTSNIVIVTIVTIILVLSTGGAGSMLFFLLDFLLFFVAIFSRPGAGLTLALAVVVAFLLNEPLFSNHELVNLISLLLMTPLAMIFSTLYRRLIRAENKIKVLSDQAKEEETDALLWLSLNFRNKMEQAIDLLSQVKSNLSLIPYHQRDIFNQLYQDLKELFLSGQELKQKIDRTGDQ